MGETVNSHLGGGTPSKNNSTYWDGDIYWASVKDIGRGKYADGTIDRITEAGLADSSSNLIPPGNLIIVTRMGLGKVSINRVPMAINQDLRALFLTSLATIDYHYIFFKTYGFEGTGLTVKGVKVEELLNIAFPLPPLAEQHRIVAKVDELMALCDQLEAAKTERERSRDRLVTASLHRLNSPTDTAETDAPNLPARQADAFRDHACFVFNHLPRLTTRPEHIKQLRQTILNLAVRGKLVSPDPDNEPAIRQQGFFTPSSGVVPFLIPAGWCWTTLKSLGRLKGGGTPSKSRPDYWDGEIPWVSPKDMKRDYIATAQLSISQEAIQQSAVNLIEPGSLLFVVRGMILAHSFPVALSRIPLTINQDMKALEFSEPEFGEYLLRALKGLKSLILAKVQRSSHGTCRLEGTDYSNLPIPIPPLAEQHRIVARIDELMALCDQLEAQLPPPKLIADAC